jgi:peptide/nickel transport system ATP-binding protein
VRNVSFAIAPGEVLGLVGESGAGKSITGAALIGLIDPPGRIAGGRIVLAGRRIDDLPEAALRKVRGKEIGAVFQDPLTALNPLYPSGASWSRPSASIMICRSPPRASARSRC